MVQYPAPWGGKGEQSEFPSIPLGPAMRNLYPDNTRTKYKLRSIPRFPACHDKDKIAKILSLVNLFKKSVAAT
ncbi:MAG: hypothetical protein COU10_00290 [Candidatus Harrisonbacteria bacterium CG10_big_fil_rev_8_21_14_0_10_45_28]|uniref:Uncharacterized protein n=1 Tax=Candidatus Harrisonbacteria bacterium CG10_big_fil_rev_8_21_14_0_10_45_28 TaxID=1974586 RepID=A0A2H0UP70_9BACT|nr:MAG: hypothetical protein COU10_00290 [Candidatus Harrisonbacteria bacterium CG10_big_fil_rev_8_21_14_0_10_45_28]